MKKKIEAKRSPIFYMGNKERLIKKGLLELFPKDINYFVEPFCGSGVVSLNVKANNYLLNDNNGDVIALLNIFKSNTKEEITKHISDRIKEFGLNETTTDIRQGVNEGVRNFYKEKYNTFRDFYNTSLEKNVLDLYTLTYYSHSNLMRFSGKGNFNVPRANDLRKFNVSFGNQSYSNSKHGEKIQNGCEFFSQDNVTICNEDFREVFKCIATEGTFIYCDPPYLNTTAIYNEKHRGGWNIEDDYALFNHLDKLHQRGGKFGMSNVFENKGIVNQHLIDWVEENGYNVHFFNGFSYAAMGKGNAKSVEVYICNY